MLVGLIVLVWPLYAEQNENLDRGDIADLEPPSQAVILPVAVEDETRSPEAISPASGESLTETDAGPSRGLVDVLGSGSVVAIIRIEGMIYGFTLDSLKRRVDRARSLGADVIVIDLDTPGGELNAALAISKYLKSLNEFTVAWINRNAYSAGILIASSCNQIIMAKHSATGDCAPIAMGTSLGPREVKKALGPLLAEFRDNAETNGFPYVLFHAMCVEGVKVFRVRHKEADEVKFVNEKDYQYLVNGVSGLDPQAASSGDSGNRVAGSGDPILGDVVQTLVAPEDRGAWELDQGSGKTSPVVYDGSTFLTVFDKEAVDIGLAEAIINDDTELKEYLKASEVQRITPTWSEGLAGWLTHPAVRGVLMLALVIGAYMELQSPGLGLPGLLAAIALIALIGAPFLVGLAEIWHVLLVFLGILLLVVEVFVAPGFGLFGISGIALILIGLILQIVPTSGSGPIPFPAAGQETWDRLLQSTIWMMLSMIASFIGLVVLTRNFGRIPLMNRLILLGGGSLESAVGAAVAPNAPVSGDEVIGEGVISVGARGRSLTRLRPSGQAIIENKTIDVISRGDWIEEGRPIRVVEIHGNRLIIEAAD